MQFALNQRDQLIHATQASADHQYYCLKCHQPLQVKTSRRGNQFFSHVSVHSPHGQTQEHLLGKQQIFMWALRHGWSPNQEYYLDQIDQRPDVYLSIHGQPVAIEFQCSPITLEKIQERNDGYRSLNIPFRWLLGSTYERKMSPAKIAQFTQTYQEQLVVPFWKTERECIAYHRYYRTSFSQFRGSKLALVKAQTLTLHRRRLTDQGLMELRSKAYQQGHILGCCPFFVHDLTPSWPLFVHTAIEWRLAVVLSMEKMKIGYEMSIHNWNHLLIECAQWLSFPCLNVRQVNRLKQQCIDQFTKQMIEIGIIKRNNSRIRYVQAPKWFNSVDDKLAEMKKGFFIT